MSLTKLVFCVYWSWAWVSRHFRWSLLHILGFFLNLKHHVPPSSVIIVQSLISNYPISNKHSNFQLGLVIFPLHFKTGHFFRTIMLLDWFHRLGQEGGTYALVVSIETTCHLEVSNFDIKRFPREIILGDTLSGACEMLV